MAQIIQPQPTWQEALGSGLGQGIQAGVTNLLEQKLQSMAQEQQANQRFKALEGLQKAGVLGEGFTPETLQALRYAPESVLNTLLKERMKAPANQAYAQALQGILGGEGVGELPGGLTEQQAGKLAEIGLKKQKQISESQQKIKPFLDAHYADYKNAKMTKQLAESMKQNLLKNKDKFPTGLISYAPEQLFRDPDVRKYAADANKLVQLTAAAKKGQVTNYKLKLEQLSKVGLNQPIETQLAILDDIIGASDDVFNTDTAIRKIKKENKGLYPEDIVDRLIQEEGTPGRTEPQIEKKAKSDQNWATFEDFPPAQYKGKKLEAEDGTIYVSDGKRWIPQGKQ